VSTVRVLLVDDHNLYREGLRLLLEQEDGIEIVGEAVDGYAAIDLTRRLRPQVVVTDIDHPGPDGYVVARVVSDHVDGVKVLVLSAYDGASYVERSWRAGATGYVVKDDPIPMLASAIRTVAEGGEFVTPRLPVPTRRRTPDW
jgi:two-component system response regulator DegU